MLLYTMRSLRAPEALLPLLSLLSQAFAASVGDCPGYVAKDIEETDKSLTATLSLAGDACNVYGDDIQDLKLLVEYQTGKCK
jgi:hypothetical protein